MSKIYQKTLKEQIELKGVGLHNGEEVSLKIKPSEKNTGIIFKRVDIKENNLIHANFNNVIEPILCTKLKNENGAITLAGRLKRFVKVAGEMISLPAMEDVLIDRWPGDDDGPAVAVEAIERDGERPVLAIFSRVALNLNEANETLKKAGFSNVGRLNHHEEVEEIPLLGTGKTNHRALKTQLAKKYGVS